MRAKFRIRLAVERSKGKDFARLKAALERLEKKDMPGAPKSPFVGLGLPPGMPDTAPIRSVQNPPYATVAANIQPEVGEATRERAAAALEPPIVQPMTLWNRTVC